MTERFFTSSFPLMATRSSNEPRPVADFSDALLNSEDIVSSCRANLGDLAADIIAKARTGDAAEFLAWFESWRSQFPTTGSLGSSFSGKGCEVVYDISDDYIGISVNRCGPLFWIRVFTGLDPDNEWSAETAEASGNFWDGCYFASKDEAIKHAKQVENSYQNDDED